MKCVILAAGISSRLYPLTSSTPKCLLTVGKYTILERTIRNVLRHDVTEFVIVTGFCANMIGELVHKVFPSLRVQFVFNKRFAETNNSYSLALSQTALRGDAMLLLDSDIVFDHRILSRVLEAPYENCLAVRRTEDYDEEEIKVTVDRKGRVLRIGKDIDKSSVLGESIGIEKFSSSGSLKLFDVLQQRVHNEEGEREFYEALFQQLIDSSVSIYAVDVQNLPCIEIDTFDDLRKARDQIAVQLDGE